MSQHAAPNKSELMTPSVAAINHENPKPCTRYVSRDAQTTAPVRNAMRNFENVNCGLAKTYFIGLISNSLLPVKLIAADVDPGKDGNAFEHEHLIVGWAGSASQALVVHAGKYSGDIRYHLPVGWDNDLGAPEYLCDIDDNAPVDIRLGEIKFGPAKNVNDLATLKVFGKNGFFNPAEHRYRIQKIIT